MLSLGSGDEGMCDCPFGEHCDTWPDLHGSLPPDALLSIKHIESTEWLPYSSPEGVRGPSGWGVGVPNTALCIAKPSANTHMSNRTEQKALGLLLLLLCEQHSC